MGTIIGEELGSNQFCTAGQMLTRLSNTKLVVSVANNTHISTATELPVEKGVLPDYYITQSIDEYLNKVDAVKISHLNILETRAKYSGLLPLKFIFWVKIILLYPMPGKNELNTIRRLAKYRILLPKIAKTIIAWFWNWVVYVFSLRQASIVRIKAVMKQSAITLLALISSTIAMSQNKVMADSLDGVIKNGFKKTLRTDIQTIQLTSLFILRRMVNRW